MFSSVLSGTLTFSSFMICLAAAAACGLIVSLAYRFCEHASKSFLLTIALLPPVVMTVIMMVNGNLGVGVAVAGSFSLVRFRSLPGKASDILVIFLAMGLGLCSAMGYALFAVLLSVIMSAAMVVLAKTPLLHADRSYRSLRITIPDDLDYTAVFEDIFRKYTTSAEIESVRTVNLGTMYQLSYEINLKDPRQEKNMIDEIRVRNGNLAVISGTHASVMSEL